MKNSGENEKKYMVQVFPLSRMGRILPLLWSFFFFNKGVEWQSERLKRKVPESSPWILRGLSLFLKEKAPFRQEFEKAVIAGETGSLPEKDSGSFPWDFPQGVQKDYSFSVEEPALFPLRNPSR